MGSVKVPIGHIWNKSCCNVAKESISKKPSYHHHQPKQAAHTALASRFSAHFLLFVSDVLPVFRSSEMSHCDRSLESSKHSPFSEIFRAGIFSPFTGPLPFPFLSAATHHCGVGGIYSYIMFIFWLTHLRRLPAAETVSIS